VSSEGCFSCLDVSMQKQKCTDQTNMRWLLEMGKDAVTILFMWTRAMPFNSC